MANLTISPEQKQILLACFLEADGKTSNVEVYWFELSGDVLFLTLKNRATRELYDVELPADMLYEAIGESGENITGQTLYAAWSIEDDEIYIQPEKEWWEMEANYFDQSVICSHVAKNALKQSFTKLSNAA